MIWRRILRGASRAEDVFDSLKGRLQKRLNRTSAVTIIPYIGYGNQREIHVRARIVENHRVQPSQDNDSIWRNLLNIYRRLDTDELPFSPVTVRFQGQEKIITADREAYILADFDPAQPLTGNWQDVEFSYGQGGRSAQAIGRIVTPPESAQFGVISDLDDTVVYTGVTNWLRLARNVFFKNAHTRLPFPGAAEFYSALQSGTSAAVWNPIFYVSNSPYNLYDLITDFFEIRGIPLGPVLLRDMGLTEKYILASRKHKRGAIERLLRTYPDLPFILIGDSGEHDPQIYLETIEKFAGRVPVVYIRDVEPHKPGTKRDRRVYRVAEKVRALGSEMLLIPDTIAAARDALQRGFITAQMLEAVEASVRNDVPDEIEQLIDAESDESV